MMSSTQDKKFCLAPECPYKSCERHPNKLKRRSPKAKVIVGNYYATCRPYISHVLDEVEKEKKV